jgi:hypothetical protein
MDKLTPIQRVGVMITIGAVVVGVSYYSDATSRVAGQSPNSPARQRAINNPTAKPVMPSGYQLSEARHDPFAVPSEYQQPAPADKNTLPERPPANPSGASAKEIAHYSEGQQDVRPVLVGVVSGNDTYRAIIQYGADSRSYRVSESVGPYQLVAISDDAVTLSGPGGKLALTLGR